MRRRDFAKGMAVAGALSVPATTDTREDRRKRDTREERRKRVKVVQLDEQLIVDIVNWCNRPEGCSLSLPITDELPKGTEILRVTPNFMMRSIDAIVYHPSFPVCPEGALPEMVGDLQYKLITKKLKDYDP